MAFKVRELRRRTGRSSNDRSEYERRFRVWKYTTTLVNIQECDLDEVIAEVGIDFGDTYPGMDGVECYDIEGEEDETSFRWIVTVRYQTPDANDASDDTPNDFDEFISQSQQQPQDPDTNMIGPKFSYGTTTVEEWREKDLDGQYFINSAKDPFQNTPPIPVTIQIERVTLNEARKPNTSKQGTAAGRKLLAGIQGEAAIHVNRTTGVRTRYYVTTYEVWIHPSHDWAFVELIDRGFNYLTTVNGQKVKRAIRLGPEKNEPQQPVNLDGAGGILSTTATNPQTKTFRIRPVGSLGVPFIS